MNVGAVDLLAQAAGSPGAAPASTIDLIDGSLAIAGTGAFDTPGDILLSASGTGRLTGGDVIFRGRSFEVGHVGRAAADATIDVDTLLVEVPGDRHAAEAGELATVEPRSAIIAAPSPRRRSRVHRLSTTFDRRPAAGEEFAEQMFRRHDRRSGYTLTDAEYRITSATASWRRKPAALRPS